MSTSFRFMETCVELFKPFPVKKTLVLRQGKERVEVNVGVTVGPGTEAPGVVLFVVHIHTFCLCHHQFSIDAFDFDNKMLVGY